MYDHSIFQEAENIVQTLDSLLMTGSFPSDEGNGAYVPCTIVELVDKREFVPAFIDGVNEDGNEPAKKNVKIQTKHEIPAHFQAEEENCAFFSENQKIKLDLINHEGRVDFSTLQSGGLNFHTQTAVDSSKSDQGAQCNFTGNSQPKYFKENNDFNGEPFLLAASNSEWSSECTEEMFFINEPCEDDSETRSTIFERIQEKNSPENLDPAFLFSSPTVQLNLTNPLVNTNKK